MSHFRYFTAGESHGPQLTSIIEGIPAGADITAESINIELARRQQGYGRGGRMKIEKDKVDILSGVRWGKSTGAPITLVVKNRDWENWQEKMSANPADSGSLAAVTRPRPGHADLTGVQKYSLDDVRDVLERSSARETAARVSVGGVAKSLLNQLGIKVGGYVKSIGNVEAKDIDADYETKWKIASESELFVADKECEDAMKRAIDSAKDDGDTVGGVVEAQVIGVPPGVGSYVQWDRKLDARIAMAVMSIQAIKGVEIGGGFEAAKNAGSKVHDEIAYDAGRVETFASPYYRLTNRAGGIEGGMSNGEAIVVRAAMKPIPTLYKPLKSIDINSKEIFAATVERSDSCAVPAALVVVEAVVAIEILNGILEKFGGDSMDELKRNILSYKGSLFER